jgi:hypothetical protein
MADHRHEVPMPARLRPQNAEAVLRIVECDALDEAREHFLGGRCHLWFHADRSVIHSSRLGPFQGERDEENIVKAILKEIVRHFCCESVASFCPRDRRIRLSFETRRKLRERHYRIRDLDMIGYRVETTPA